MRIPDQLGLQPVLPILNQGNPEDALRIAEALLEGGLRAFEITLRNPGALDSLQAVRAEFPDLALGAGTILQREQLEWAKESGLDFGVSPGWSDELWESSRELEFPLFPGVLTPTELTHAISAGCRALKVFPIEPMGGIAYLKSLIAPFRSKDLKYLPTGGIGRDQVEPYLLEEAVLTVGGSWVTPKNLIEKKDFAGVTELAIASLSLGNRNS